MKGRALWGFALPTLAVALLALALLVSGAAGGSGHGKHRGGGPGEMAKGQPGYHFLVFDAVSGASDRMIITGDGSFNGNQAHGGGTFDHFQTGTTLPLHIVASGTWRANDVVTFTHSATSHGPFEGGVLVMHATFFPTGQPEIKNVTVEVDCNLGPIGSCGTSHGPRGRVLTSRSAATTTSRGSTSRDTPATHGRFSAPPHKRPRRSACTRSTDSERRRAASPGCGVKTVGATRLFNSV